MICQHYRLKCAACEQRAHELAVLDDLLTATKARNDGSGNARLWTLSREARETERDAA